MTPVLTFKLSNISTTFSVQTLPTDFFAYGHPPNPPTEQSNIFIPFSKAIKIFSIALPFVSWKWAANLSIGTSLTISSNNF